MSKIRTDHMKSLPRLLRFLFWYAVIVAAALYALPLAGQLAQAGYEALSSGARAVAVLAFIAVVVAWQLADRRDRSRESRENVAGDPESSTGTGHPR
jgi:ABC-type amino acid transport system permease subunit